jgi:hypothetical protein
MGPAIMILLGCGAGVRRNPVPTPVDTSVDSLPADAGIDGTSEPDAPLFFEPEVGPGPDAPPPAPDAPELPPDALLPPDGATDACAPGLCRSGGEDCEDDSQCLSGFCVHGSCCVVRACDTHCSLCGGPGGTCVDHTGADISASCGLYGACDQAGTCRHLAGERCKNDGECLSNRCAGGTCTCGLCASIEFFDLGTVPMSSTASFTFEVTNRSPTRVEGFVIRAPGDFGLIPFEIGPTNCGDLDPDQSCEVTVTFFGWETPGVQWRNLEITWNGLVMDRVTVAATLVPRGTPTIQWPDPNFGPVKLGTLQRRTFTLVNPADGETVAPTLHIEGADSRDFQLVGNDCTGAIAPRHYCEFAVVFKPLWPGLRSARIVARRDQELLVSAGLAGHGVP